MEVAKWHDIMANARNSARVSKNDTFSCERRCVYPLVSGVCAKIRNC